VGLVFLLSSSYSFSEITHGVSNNASANGYNWVMANVLPNVSGLSINAVIYRYSVEKVVSDPFIVDIQNKNARGDGLIFHSRDDWSGLPGNRINRVIGVNGIDASYWGDGEIRSSGIGSISEASLVYAYTRDSCAETGVPIVDTKCPNYKITLPDIPVLPVIPEVLIPDLISDKPYVKESEEVELSKELIKPSGKKGRADSKISKIITQNSLINSDVLQKAVAFEALNNIPKFELYSFTMNGGVYRDTVKLQDGKLPDGRRGLVNTWAQEELHQKMVDLQYNSNKKGN